MPVIALQNLIKQLNFQSSYPLFSYVQDSNLFPLTASKAGKY